MFEKKLISDICDVSSSKRIYLSEYQDEGIPFYRGKEIIEKYSNKNISNELFISKKRYEEIKQKFGVPQIGDILMTAVGTIGISWYVNETEFYFKDGNLIWFKNFNKDMVNSKYLYYIFNSKSFKERIKNISIGSTQKAITIEQIKKIELNLPKIDIQNKVAKILDNINKKIKLNNKINNNLHDLVEQQFNEIYSKGSLKRLDTLLFNVSTGSRPKGGAQESGIPSIGAEKIEKFGIYDYSLEKYISEEYYEKLKNGKLNSEDVLLYKDGAYAGKVSMCLNDFPHKKAAVNEHVFILNTENNWAQNYLYFTLYNKDNKEMLHRLASSKAAQPGLNKAELKSIKVNICDKKDIINFENSVKPIMKKIANNSLENKKLAELRDTLLPKLTNGEIDLDNIEL